MKISELPEPYKSRAKNHRRRWGDLNIDGLRNAFDWDATPEGYEYWHDCHNVVSETHLPPPHATWAKSNQPDLIALATPPAMTLREYAAVHIAAGAAVDWRYDDVADWAVACADALIARLREGAR